MRGFSAYSDESGIFDHRFQSIAVVSGRDEMLDLLRSRLQEELDNRQIPEVKFSRIAGYTSPVAQAARQFMTTAVKGFAISGKTRIDILTWDTADSRHAVLRRDDLANLGRMYYHLLIHMGRQWNQSRWSLYPDNNPKVDWDETAKYLNAASLYRTNPQQPELVEVPRCDELQFGRPEQVDSVREPLIQLADLFAGLARYSCEEGRQCIQWLDSQVSRQQLRFRDLCATTSVRDSHTRRRLCLYQLIGKLYTLCSQYKLYVSLREMGCLWTRVCTKPVNFWHYEPQSIHDKAPVR